jgi:hypothetical protein
MIIEEKVMIKLIILIKINQVILIEKNLIKQEGNIGKMNISNKINHEINHNNIRIKVVF